ncbi:hypothetical protein EON65_14105 [archaeon]|nr:MAG: hypothetical protein EON65_14105 [archaeon]
MMCDTDKPPNSAAEDEGFTQVEIDLTLNAAEKIFQGRLHDGYFEKIITSADWTNFLCADINTSEKYSRVWCYIQSQGSMLNDDGNEALGLRPISDLVSNLAFTLYFLI